MYHYPIIIEVRSPSNTSNRVCLCCSASNDKFVSLRSCVHRDFLDYCEIQKGHENAYVCTNCHELLRKIQEFKEKVQQNSAHLHRLAKEGRTKDIYNFGISKVTITDSLTENCDEIEKTSHFMSNDYGVDVKVEKRESVDADVTVEDVKDENEKDEDEMDVEHNVPLSIIKKTTGKKQRKTPLLDMSEGKIRIIHLSVKEMQDEKDRERKSDAYLMKPYKCNDCVLSFNNSQTLQQHLIKKHKERPGSIRCNLCNVYLANESSFKEHMKRHTLRYECCECGKRGKSLTCMIQHYNQQHEHAINCVFKCFECSYTSTNNRAYRYHRQSHKSRVACPQCGKLFRTNCTLKLHLLESHGGGARYSCARCSAVFSRRSALHAHHTRHSHGAGHAAPAPAYCAPCDQHFWSARALHAHLKNNSKHVRDEDKKFICDECGKKFIRKTSLRDHVAWEHLKVSHECDICNKIFMNARTLKRHKQTVHEKKRAPRDKICDHCGRGFTTNQMLITHIRTHTGERPLSCAHCAATFAHNAALYTHVRLKHRKPRAGPPPA